jgi:small subunit ribosomal protein S6e
MPIKLNISEKGKAWKIEVEPDVLSGKSIGDVVHGKEIKHELEGYEMEITGGSDIAGFPMAKNIEGIGLKKALLSKGWGMRNNQEGLRLRKTLRGNKVSEKISQLNMKVTRTGKKHLAEIFPDQNKPKEVKSEEKPAPAENESA